MIACFLDPEINRSRYQKDRPIDHSIKDDIHESSQRRMIEILDAQDEEYNERQAGTGPDQLTDFHIPPLNHRAKDHGNKTNRQN
jgi:hypothetical protein